MYLDGERHESEARDDRDLLGILACLLGADRASVVAPPADNGFRSGNCRTGGEPCIRSTPLDEPPNQFVPNGDQRSGVSGCEATAHK